MAKHFLDLSAVSESDLRVIMDDAHSRKAANKAGTETKPLAGKMLAMIFEKPSTRTRVSFDVGMRQLGGETLFLSGTEMQLGRAETAVLDEGRRTGDIRQAATPADKLVGTIQMGDLVVAHL